MTHYLLFYPGVSECVCVPFYILPERDTSHDAEVKELKHTQQTESKKKADHTPNRH